MNAIRRARFRSHWKRNSLILQSVSAGLLGGFLASRVFGLWLSTGTSELLGQVVAVIVAAIVLFWRWIRAEVRAQASGKSFTTPEDGSVVPASALRYPLMIAAGLVMIVVFSIAILLLPEWASEWVGMEIVVLFLTVIVTTNDAFGPSA